MKKLFIIATALVLIGCGNTQIIDTTWEYDYAYISLPDGMAEGKVSMWRDYSDSDMVQVTLEDGTVYYTHGSNVVLVKEGK